jgi:PAS domain S-box-containing protein
MKLALRLSLTIASLVAGSILIISYLTWQTTVSLLQGEIIDNFEVSALRTINQIDTFLCERYHNIQLIANDSIIASRDAKPEDITNRLMDYRNRLKVYSSLSFFDLNRIRIADTAGLRMGRQDEGIGFWKDVYEGKVSAAADCRMAEDLQTEVVYFAAPVRDRKGEIFGVVVANIPMGVLYSMITQVQGLGSAEPSGILIDLVSREGLLLFSNHNRKDVLKMRVNGWESIRHVAGEQAFAELKGDMPGYEEHISVLVSEQGFLDFPGNGWSLLLSMPRSVALAPAVDLRNKILLVLLVILIFSILMSVLIARTLSRPIMRLAGAIQHVASGSARLPVGPTVDGTGRYTSAILHVAEYAQRVPGGRRKDEIGVLIRGFNEMLEQIQARNTLLRQAQEQLEQRVRERTAQLTAEITERTRIAEVLQLTQFAVDRASDAIFWLREDASLSYVNEAACQMAGYPREELLEKVAYDLGLAASRDEWARNWDELERRPALTYEADLRTKVGQSVTVEVTINRLEHEGNEYGCIFARNINERRQLEEQLRQSEKMNAIGQLAGGIAHDFNNQLTGVMGYADMLTQALTDPAHRRYAGKILASAKHSAALTRQLLAFARKGKYQTVPVNMHTVIDEVVELLRHSIDKRIVIRKGLFAETPMVTGDQAQLQNAILNLVLNARDAMPDGGRLEFTTTIVTLVEQDCRTQGLDLSPGRHLRISVADTGTGMTEEVHRHLFEPFFTTKPSGKGTGMGLASVFGTVKNHHGHVTCETAPGKGTTFHMYLPVLEGAVVNLEMTVSTKPLGGGQHILVVDDEEDVRDLVADMLRDAGYQVTLCEDGEEAIRSYSQEWASIHLVLLDMVMPKLGGQDTFRALRQINPAVKALLSSGYSIDSEAQSILDEGVLGFIQKPFRRSELLTKVADVLNLSEPS